MDSQPGPKVTVVTISFNQAEFLERTIQSILAQQGAAFEYIIVDPGSTDGSRDIIRKYRDRLAAAIFEPDSGPADGLNKGFAQATGDIFYYLNSDDTVAPGAFAAATAVFRADPGLAVLCGHAWVVDENDNRLRRVWSDPYNPLQQAYGAAIQIQPSTFIRAEAFHKVGGFNIANRSNWDGELIVDICRQGGRLKVFDKFMSNYRLHSESITGGGGNAPRLLEWQRRQFEKIMGRPRVASDRIAARFWWLYRQLRNPAAFVERLLNGPIYRRAARAR